ncbi:MAG: hypothetical protein NTX03_13330 [Bacteroidetes bacterium]|nr:hypothetical protein [Bacteroidota bacterium]
MINVIVVPETEEYKISVSHQSIVWISKNLGIPDLEGKNALYLAPYWLNEEPKGVLRLFHILSINTNSSEASEIYLGNSFITPSIWNNMGQPRRFEYHNLESFGLMELRPGLLIPIALS